MLSIAIASEEFRFCIRVSRHFETTLINFINYKVEEKDGDVTKAISVYFKIYCSLYHLPAINKSIEANRLFLKN